VSGPTLLVLTSNEGHGLAIRIIHDPNQAKIKRAYTAMIKQARKRFPLYAHLLPQDVRKLTHLNAYFIDRTDRGWPVQDWRWDT
jgi:hypothetical protein